MWWRDLAPLGLVGAGRTGLAGGGGAVVQVPGLAGHWGEGG